MTWRIKMANSTLFNTKKNYLVTKPTDTVNLAGGSAYSYSDEHKLCQYVVTSTLGNMYYTDAKSQLDEILKLTQSARPELIAKAAVYGHETGNMKDVPALLLAVLAARGELTLLKTVFDRVITNTKMLLNFVQIVRSGQTGRKSFGTAVRNLIRDWLVNKSAGQLLSASIGHSNPSLADVIKMVHPKAKTQAQNATFAYLLGKEYNKKHLPAEIKHFESF
jgi:60 kDa SS-A/Ro ribonucleoprotein